MIWDLENNLYSNVLESKIVENFLTVKVVGVDKVLQFLKFCFIPHLVTGQGDQFIVKMLKAEIPFTREISVLFGILFVASSAKIIANGAFNYMIHCLQGPDLVSGLSMNKSTSVIHKRMTSFTILSVLLIYPLLLSKD